MQSLDIRTTFLQSSSKVITLPKRYRMHFWTIRATDLACSLWRVVDSAGRAMDSSVISAEPTTNDGLIITACGVVFSVVLAMFSVVHFGVSYLQGQDSLL